MGNGESMQAGDYQEPTLPAGMLEVRISVYKLNVTGVGFLDSLGASLAGAYHSGLVVAGQEWSFGGHDEDGVSGVYDVEPETNPDFTFFKRHIIGQVKSSKQEIEKLIKRLQFSAEWQGTNYDLVEKNCNHFTSELCWQIMRKRPPDWINNTADTMARARRKEAAEEEELHTALAEYDSIYGSNVGPPAVEDNCLTNAPGAMAYQSTFKNTFTQAYTKAWEDAQEFIKHACEDDDPDRVKKEAEKASIKRATVAARLAADAVAFAARVAKPARQQQEAAGVAAWDASWQQQSGAMLREWQNSAVAGEPLPGEPERKAKVDAALQVAAEAAAAAAKSAQLAAAPASSAA